MPSVTSCLRLPDVFATPAARRRLPGSRRSGPGWLRRPAVLAAALLGILGATGAQANLQYQLLGNAGGIFSATPFTYSGTVTTDGLYADNSAFDQSRVLSWVLAITNSVTLATSHFSGTGASFMASVNGSTVNALYAQGNNLLLLSGRGSGEINFSQGGTVRLREFVQPVSGSARHRFATTALGTWDDDINHFNVYTPVWANGRTVVTAAPVPEAQTWAMLLAGLGVMGFIGRRRSGRRSLAAG